MSDYILRPPGLPSWQRYRRLFGWSSSLSILRALEYEQLETWDFRGRVLDFGGGENANYRDAMARWMRRAEYESVNIDSGISPTYLVAPGAALPVGDASFDMVVALNTLEHVYDVGFVLAEFARVLKPNGQVVMTVPFLFRMHGHPDDYFRGTPSWWGRTLAHHGFSTIEVNPLLWGAFSTGAAVSGLPGPFRRIRMHLALLLDLAYARLRFGTGQRYDGPAGTALCNSPLGFLITARRGDAA